MRRFGRRKFEMLNNNDKDDVDGNGNDDLADALWGRGIKKSRYPHQAGTDFQKHTNSITHEKNVGVDGFEPPTLCL